MNIYAIIAILFWGLNNPLCKDGLQQMDPLTFTFWRFTIATPFLWLVAIMQRHFRLETSDFPAIFFQGFAGITLYQILFIFSLSFTSTTNTILLISLSPIFTVILLFFLRKLIINRFEIAGIVLGFIGVALVVLSKPQGINTTASASFVGNMLAVMTAVIWGGYSVFNAPWIKKYTSLSITTYAFTLAAICFFILALIFKKPIWPIPPRAYFSLFYTAVGGGVLGHLSWFKAVGEIGPKKTMVYMYLNPVLSSFFAFLILKESIGLLQISGAIAIFIGLYFAQRKT